MSMGARHQCEVCDGNIGFGSPASRCNCGRHGPVAFDPQARGFHAVYRPDERNHCPGCGREHWLIGRLTAECAFCGTAMALQDSARGPAPRVVGFSTRPGVGPLE